MICQRYARFNPLPPVSGADISPNDRPFQVRIAGVLVFCTAVLLAGLLLWPGVSAAQAAKAATPSGNAVPRWAMLRNKEVYARNGPSMDNPIAWTYHARSLPVQIISETHDWRLVCDPDGGVAWVNKMMLQDQKTVLSPAGIRLEMRAAPKPDATVKAVLKERSLANLDKCKNGWCKLTAGGVTGWVPEAGLWGTQETAVCRRPAVFEAGLE